MTECAAPKRVVRPLTPSRWHNRESIFLAKGCAVALLETVVALARRRDARPIAMWLGTKSIFDRVVFKEVARRKPRLPMVRKALIPTRT